MPQPFEVVGTLNITASYAGNSKLASSTSTALRQVVKSTAKGLSTTALASSVNPSMYGQAVTWMAMVTTSGSVPPTGNVVFRWSRDGQNYAIGTSPLNTKGVATLTRSNLNVDPFGEPYPLVAAYSGDAGISAARQQCFRKTFTRSGVRRRSHRP